MRRDDGEWGSFAPLATQDGDPIVAALNRALVNEITGYLRHKSRFFDARERGAGHAARESLDQAHLLLDQAQRLAAHIVSLGGAPDFALEEFADADRIAMRLTAT